MKYKKDQFVYITKNGKKYHKQISDYEIIDGIEIYYMTDNTSYSSGQIMTVKEKNTTQKNKVKQKNDELLKLVDFDKIVNNIAKLIEKHKKNID